MTFDYTCYTNIDSGFAAGYQPGNRLVRGHTGTIDAASVELALHALWDRHNADDRPDGQLCPSMSTGDVIDIAGQQWTPTRFGFAQVTVDAGDRITDRTWADVIADLP